MLDKSVFKKFHVNAGEPFEDMAYIYAHVREHFSDIGEAVIRRFQIQDFHGTDGNIGKYIVFDSAV